MTQELDLRVYRSPDSSGVGGNPENSEKSPVQNVVDALGQDPQAYFKTLSDRWIKQGYFREMVHPEFQALRIQQLGFKLPITKEDRQYYGIKVEEIDSFGPEKLLLSESKFDPMDWLTAINNMRGFVAAVIAEKGNGSIPEINDNLIDPPPVKKKYLDTAVAPIPGMFIYEWEEFEERWRQEDPEFYQATVDLKNRLTGFYSARIIGAYEGILPDEYLAKKVAEIRNVYKEDLMEYPMRTYAMLTRPPHLIEVTTINPHKN